MRDVSYATPLSSQRAQREFTLTREQAKKFFAVKGARIATLAQTMGPNWRDIYWIYPHANAKQCYTVVGDTTRLAVLSAIGYVAPSPDCWPPSA